MFNNHANSDGVNQTRAAARGEISNQSIPTLQTHGKLGNIAALMASNLQGAQAPSCHAGSDPVVIAAPAATVPPQVSTLACMKTAKRWLLHKDKRPFYANGSSRGKTDTPEDLAMLVTYEEACAAFISNPGQFSGLGFALGPDGTGWYWQGIDLDNVVENNLSHLANALPGYVEKSPSAKGCHAIGYGRHFATLGSNGSGTEAYDSGRYFTFTGDVIRDASISCIADFVASELAPVHSKTENRQPIGGTVMFDAKVITDLRSALMHMRADDYHLWIQIGMALHEMGDTGRGLWLEWSATSPKFSPLIAAKKWDSFKPTGTGYKVVFSEAQRHGWINPNSNAANSSTTQVQYSKQDQTVELDGTELITKYYVDWDGDADNEVPDIIAGLVADEDVTLLGGHGGIGKSFLTLQMACAIATGQPVLNHGTRQVRVLYYSAEDGRKRISRRMKKIVDQFNIDEVALRRNLVIIDASELEPLYGEPAPGKLAGPKVDFANLQKMVDTFDPQLLIVDGASDTFDGNEISRREVRGFIKLLRRVHRYRKIGVLLTVHIDRASARGYSSNDDGYAGSAAWHNSCRRRMFLQLKKEKDEDGNDVSETITLKVMKNQDGLPEPDMELQRGMHGLWQLGAHFGGSLTQNTAATEQEDALLSLIAAYYRRGKFMGTSVTPQATTGVYPTLHNDPEFPQGLGKKRTAELVKGLERAGRLIAEEYTRTNRGKGERWRVIETPVA